MVRAERAVGKRSGMGRRKIERMIALPASPSDSEQNVELMLIGVDVEASRALYPQRGGGPPGVAGFGADAERAQAALEGNGAYDPVRGVPFAWIIELPV
jgi:hypothetical protein